MKKLTTRFLSALALVCAPWASTVWAVYDLGGSGRPAKNSIITYDGINTPGYVNDLVGATTFYQVGIFGELTISANIEAGAIWGGASGHEDLTLSTFSYSGTGAVGEVDRHATWVGSVLGGLNYNRLLSTGDNFLHEFGIAPATFLASGAIATQWNPPPQNPDMTFPSYSGNFTTTQAAIYSSYNRFTN